MIITICFIFVAVDRTIWFLMWMSSSRKFRFKMLRKAFDKSFHKICMWSGHLHIPRQICVDVIHTGFCKITCSRPCVTFTTGTKKKKTKKVLFPAISFDSNREHIFSIILTIRTIHKYHQMYQLYCCWLLPSQSHWNRSYILFNSPFSIEFRIRNFYVISLLAVSPFFVLRYFIECHTNRKPIEQNQRKRNRRKKKTIIFHLND